MSEARASLVVAASIAGILAGCNSADSPPRIGGGGATSIEPLINSWQSAYYASHGVQVDYIGAGSGNGVQQMIRRAIQFGCTDSPLNPEQLRMAQSIGGPVLHVPLAITGVVPVCRVPGIADSTVLRFSGSALAGIFLGEIVNWNDPVLRELNPETRLPDLPIKVVSRSEPSGTTAIFAEYLARSQPALWQEQNMGQGPNVAFAVGIRQKGNPGVAGEVRRNPGAIGYVELTYATRMGRTVSFGAVRNRHGQFVVASPDSITAAVASLRDYPDDLCFSLIDALGPDCYPICGADWAVFYRTQPAQNGRRLVEFLRWATTRDAGQAQAASLGYAPLPEPLIRGAHAKLDSVIFD